MQLNIKKIKNKINLNKGQLLIVGSFIIFIGISLLGFKIYKDYSLLKSSEDNINIFFEQQLNDKSINTESSSIEKNEIIDNTQKNIGTKNQEQYIAVIEIPKINLKTGIYDKTSKNNKVNKNIEVLKEADLPNVINGNYIIAGHSGNSKVSYFKNLYKLNIDDEVYLYFENNKYLYKITNFYDIEKNGTAKIIENEDTSHLTMITCKSDDTKQLVVVCSLVEVL